MHEWETGTHSEPSEKNQEVDGLYRRRKVLTILKEKRV